MKNEGGIMRKKSYKKYERGHERSVRGIMRTMRGVRR